MPGKGDLLVQKYDNSIPLHAPEQLSSRGCTYSIALQDHPEPLQRPMSISYQFSRTVVVYLAPDLDLAGEEIGQCFLDSFADLGRVDLGLSNY
jgi:hypothetical protein